MKTTIYYSSEYEQITSHYSSNFNIIITELARSWNNSTNIKLYKIESDLVSEEYIKENFVWDNYPGQFIDKIDAHILGRQLQPDRQIENEQGDLVDFSFSLLDVEEAKEVKYKQVEAKTKEISSTFVYDGNTFNANDAAIGKWSFLVSKILRKKAKGFTDEQLFPINNKVRDVNKNFVTIPDFDYLDDLLDAGEAVLDTAVDGEQSLIDDIENAESVEDFSSIIDNRN